MTAPPPNPLIFHITHVDNLPAIIECGELLSDRAMMALGGPTTAVGMSKIKQRRLHEIKVTCHPGKMVGDFVPFYFCARSVMLYLLHRSNHADLSYAGGQAPIVHLVADLKAVVAWAQSVNRLWAFTLSNAGAHYVEFRNDLRQLHEIDWQAVVSADFRQPHVREGKQAEFLLHGAFPWHLVRRIGVHSRSVATQVATLVNAAAHRPTVTVEPSWYY